MSNYYIIVNPTAGRGKGSILGQRLEQRLPELKLDYKLEYTKAPWHAAELAQKAASDFETIVVAGGDGTLHEALNGLAASADGLQGKRMALIPEGSGNDFARTLRLPVDMERSLQILLRNRSKKIDIGKANERYFHNGLGVGFDAWVVDRAMKVKHLRGNAIYLYSVLRTLLSYKPKELLLHFGGKTLRDDHFMITVGNGVSLGGGFYLTPDALIDDNLFDLCIIQNMPILSIIKNLLKVYSGKHKEDPRVQMDRTDKLKIEAECGFAYHADGELISLNQRELNVEILPSALDFIC